MIIYLFEEVDNHEELVLHFPDSPGSFIACCGASFHEYEVYLPDEDQAIADFCPRCAEAWIEAKTTNTNNWRFS